MKKRVMVYAIAISILLTTGLLIFRFLNQSPQLNLETDFRRWLWEVRQLDLIVQVLLVFGGALGIAAILPIEGADE